MATRVGKYKITKRESALNLTDGGTVTGNLTLTGNIVVGNLNTPGADPGVDGQLFCTSSVKMGLSSIIGTNGSTETGSAKIVLCSQG